MSKSDIEIAREIMYKDTKTKSSTTKPLKELKIQNTGVTVVLESDGKRHFVPSITAFNSLVMENEKNKNDLRQAQTDIRKLTEALKKMDSAVKFVERELTNKADLYDNG